jgi:Acetyltransferase (GNAT) family.
VVYPVSPYIRGATLDDKPRILKLVEHTWSWGDYIPSVLDDWLTRDNSRVFVCISGDELVGMVHLSVEGRGLGWLEGARVALHHRNKGIATMLATHVVEYASNMGLSKLRLAVSVNNKPSIRHVEKVGFRAVKTFKRVSTNTSVINPLASTRKLVEDEVSTALTSRVYDLYGGLYYKSFRWLDLDADTLTRLSLTGRAFWVNKTLLIHSSEYDDDDGRRVAEIGYTQPDGNFPLEDFLSIFALRVFSKVDLILPEELELLVDGFNEEGERFIVFERTL